MAGVDRPQEEALLTRSAKSSTSEPDQSHERFGGPAGRRERRKGGASASLQAPVRLPSDKPPTARYANRGLGLMMGDEGSAYTVTLAGLRSAVRAADGRQQMTRLLSDFLDRLGLSEPNDLLETIYLSKRDRAWIASLADVVTTAASAGDPAAVEIIKSAARELALLVATTAGKLDLDQTPTPFCFTGGLLLNTPDLQHRLVEQLANQNIPVTECAPVANPVLGAIKLASQLLNPAR